MASVNFRIRSEANKEVSIKIYLSTGRNTSFLEMNTGFTINPSDWKKTETRKKSESQKGIKESKAGIGIPKQNSPENKNILSNLKKLNTFIFSEVNTANSNGDLVDAYWLKGKIDECFGRVKKSSSNLLTNHVQYIIDNANTRKIKGTNKIGLSQNRIKGYKSFKKIIENYEIAIKEKIHFQNINQSFVDKFTNWLFNTKNYSTNTSGKILDNLKTVCLDAQKTGIKINPHSKQIEGFKEQNEDRFIQTLSFEELDQIRIAKLNTEAQDNARNWLLLGCELGQRAGDLLRLKPEDLRYKNNRIYFDIEQRKTGKAITVGVIAPHIIDIVENKFPYPISQQKLNKHIKDVCELAKIDQLTEGRKYDKTTGRKKLDFYPKYQLITSHSFRRTFATLYYKKIPTPVLIGITGHSKESLFLDYINRREDKDQNADLFMQYYESMHQEKEPKMRVVKNASNQ